MRDAMLYLKQVYSTYSGKVKYKWSKGLFTLTICKVHLMSYSVILGYQTSAVLWQDFHNPCALHMPQTCIMYATTRAFLRFEAGSIFGHTAGALRENRK